MRLLFTNHQLTHYTGTELFVRELTTALKKRDHQVAVFSTRLGKVAEEIRAAGIPVVDDPADIPFTPDLIHGQHHFETLAALLAFPLCPALFHCHSSGRWQETPLIHPRIIRYAVITPRYMPWFKEEFNIPADKIDVVFNTVDLTRFQTVRTPSTTPEKALLFTSTISDGTVLDTLKAACKQCDLPLDLAGHSLGKPVDHPEELLPKYDLVFAAGRTAIEAMACGCAVIPIAVDKSGRLICPRTFETSQKVNFSSRKQYPLIRKDLVIRQIKRYNADDAVVVTRRTRAELGTDTTCDRLEALYQKILAEYTGPPSSDQERIALKQDALFLAKRAHSLTLDLDGIPPETQDLVRALQHATEHLTKTKRGWESTKSKRIRSQTNLTKAKQKLEVARQLLEKSPFTRPAWKNLRQHWEDIDRR